jgi:hypothetical protein
MDAVVFVSADHNLRSVGGLSECCRRRGRLHLTPLTCARGHGRGVTIGTEKGAAGGGALGLAG